MQLFDPRHVAAASHQRELAWLNAIHQALENDEFVLYGQPIFDLRSGEPALAGIEVLLRLRQDGVLHLPGTFMPTAEAFRLAPDIDRWVVKAVLEFLAQPESLPAEIVTINVNLSAESLEQHDFVRDLGALIDAAAVDPHRLCFEITESAAMVSPLVAAELLGSIRAKGCRFALDDFGNGLSSFAYLKQLPLEIVKIDGMFITDIVQNPTSQAMARSIADVSSALGKTTIAEGIETAEALKAVRDLGIEFGQGFHLGRPEPWPDLVSRLRAGH